MVDERTGWEQPELVPARMVNEYCYCPRLFYLEWVQARFVDNDDTVEGRWVHRVVDSPAGSEPPDGNESDRPVPVTSMLLSSEQVGAVCRIDLVEINGRAAVPIDYKRGKVPDNDERSWEPERVQLCIQGLILRDAGYECDHGVLYFVGSRTRVDIALTDNLIDRTTKLLSDLREVAGRAEPPAPLVDSPKCPRCSLVGICLPDETNLLAERTSRSPRRLVPSDTDARPLYVTEQGARLGKRNGRVEVKADREVVASVRAIDVSQVCLFGNVQVSTQLVRALLGDAVPVCWFSYGGWFAGMAFQPSAKHVELRIRQIGRMATGNLQLAREVVQSKIANSRTMLLRNAPERPERAIESMASLVAAAGGAESANSLLGIEGTAARLYFGSFPAMLRSPHALPGEPFAFEGRNRRPPADPVNCLLSFCYSLLVKDLTATLQTVGLDPYVGFYHRPRFGRPALALDLAEELRPLIAESVVLRLVNNGEVAPNDFVVRAGGVALTSKGRRSVIAAYERRLAQEITHPLFGYRVSYRRILEVQARLLGAFLLGEVAAYQGFTTR
jgi:CRISPR-associated protein Cas1